MKLLLLLGSMLLLAALGLQMASMRAGVHAATFDIGVSGFSFDPANRTISTGDTIEWSWSTSPDEHNVIFVSDASQTSGAPSSSDTYSRTFNTAGSFAYYCEVHGTQQGGGMSGTITVQAANTPTPDDDDETPTRTATPQPSATPTGTVVGTVTPVATITPVTPAPPPNGPSPVATVEAGGGAGGEVTAPDTGTGGVSSGGASPWVSLALAVAGAGMVAAATFTRRRTR
jgi:plastocyanin